MKKHLILMAGMVFAGMCANAQNVLGGGQVSGNIQLDGQISHADTVIGSSDVPQKLLMNARADILYTNGGFSAGLRFESYQDPMLGFNAQYKGQGVANYFVSYEGEKLGVTAGNFYEQFGNGMILRAYEDRYLGLDNALRGFSVKYRPMEGVVIKGLVGRQRCYWDYGKGLVRGVDAEVNLNSVVNAWKESKTHLTLGGGFVSKYEDDESVSSAAEGYKLVLPLNVGAGSVRMDLNRGGWSLLAEYARKSQDPNAMNNFVYHDGEALFLSGSYSQKGFSANVQAKRVENMGFKSVRSQSGEMLYINYIPAITKQHTYAFLTLYPYATQNSGEMGLQADLMYKIKKGTLLGGKYGTDIHLNASAITGIDDSTIGGRGSNGYVVNNYLGTGELYYADATAEVAHKFSASTKLTATYGYVVFNPAVEGHAGENHHNHVVVVDLTHKINKKNVIRLELEALESDSKYSPEVNDKRCGDWLMGLVEYNFTSAFFVALSDQFCYRDGNKDANGVGANYPSVSLGYTHGATRLQVGYGKQREGIICIGGVCRQVPASNGLTFSLTTSF